MKYSTAINNTVFIAMAVLMLPIVASAQLNINATGSGGANGSVGGTVNSATNVDVGAGINSGTSSSVQANGTMQTSVGIMSSASVQTLADLEVFASSAKAQHANVESVKIASKTTGSAEAQSNIAVKYNHRGYLFGLFPVTVRSTTEVAATTEGTADVRTHLPWWSFMVTSENYSQADLEAKLKSNTTISGYTRVNASAAERARVAEALITEVQANATAHASVK